MSTTTTSSFDGAIAFLVLVCVSVEKEREVS